MKPPVRRLFADYRLAALALSLAFLALDAPATFGQSFQIRSRVTDLPAALAVAPLQDNSGGRPHPAVARGARIGFAVGLAVGVLYFGTKKCEELGCLAKWAFGVPVMASLTGFVGALIGAEIGLIASGGGSSARPHVRFRVTLRF